ncbi:MAG: DUF4430 domain-containing protein [Oscillospiraceae bacterium]|nr:DUF4430 domain-containing protein [Oscillospiraceae bacterium]
MNNQQKKPSKKSIVAVAVLLVLVIGAIIAYFALRPAPPERVTESKADTQQTAAPADPGQEPGGEAPEAPDDAPEAPDDAQPDDRVDPEPGKPNEISVTVEIIHGDGTTREVVIDTEALTLREALEQEKLIEGSESEYGLFVTGVDGETADGDQQQWWCFTKGGEMLMTGVDSTYIGDGEHYEITLTTGW